MARTVDVAAHTERRNLILDAAQQLVISKGYEQMTIQDVLEATQLSKGGFFHYFPSKYALLEGITDRLGEQVLSVLRPVVTAQGISPLTKLQRFFVTMVAWKTARRPLFVQMLRVWYADDNAIVRDKVRTVAIDQLTPLLAAIVREGAEEKVLTTNFPDEIAEAVLTLIWSLSDTLARQLVATVAAPGETGGEAGGGYGPVPRSELERMVAAYTEAVERMLGTPANSLCIVDRDTLQEWFRTAGDTPLPRGASERSVSDSLEA